MAITKLSNPTRYKVKVFMGWKDNGGRIDKTKIVYGSKREAQKVERELKTLKDTGKVDRSTETLNQHAPKWLRSIRHNVRSSSLTQYESRLKPALEFMGEKQLKKISFSEIQRFFNSMFDSGLKYRTVQYTHTVLKACLDDAVSKGKIITNPMTRYKLPKNNRTSTSKAFSREEAQKLLEAARGSEHYLFYCLMLFAGLRPNEVAGLTWACVDLDKSFIRVEKTVTRTTTKNWTFDKPKTTKSNRTLTIGSFLNDLLCTHKLNSSKNSYDLVLTNNMLEPIDYRTIRKEHFNPLREALDLPKYPMYKLRATHLTHFEQVAGLQATSNRAGHSSIQITSSHYLSPQLEAEKIAIKNFEESFLNSTENAVN